MDQPLAGVHPAAAEGPSMIAELLRFLEIDDDTKAQSRELWQLLAPKADAAIEAFYVTLKLEFMRIIAEADLTPA